MIKHLARNRRLLLNSAILIVLIFFSQGFICFPSIEGSNHDKIVVAVITEPLASVVKYIGGEKVKVVTIIPANVDPHEYEPPMNTLLSTLSEARLLVVTAQHHYIVEEKIYQLIEEGLINVRVIGYEEYLEHGLRLLRNPKTDDINFHGFHYSINGLRAIASTIASHLSEIDKDNLDYYYNRLMKYFEYIDNIENSVDSLIDRRYRVIIYTPVLQYLVKELDLDLVDVVVSEYNVEASERDVLRMLSKLKNGEADFILLSDEEALKNPKLVDLFSKENLKYFTVPLNKVSNMPELASLSIALQISSQASVIMGERSSSEYLTLLLLSITVNIVLSIIVIFLVIKGKKSGKRFSS
ncbi:MAG: zinc ABC transporter substrate-binding protein [Aigarchaeota archaeon]|nr:zinc ABC transporter substrate-binding protein [Aigarchaeota archaeon]